MLPPAGEPGAVPEVSYPPDAEVRVVGQGGDIRWRRARVRVGAGLAGERARVVEAAAGLEVHHGTYHVRSVAGALLVPHRRA